MLKLSLISYGADAIDMQMKIDDMTVYQKYDSSRE